MQINGGLDTNSSETGTVILSGSNSSTSTLTDFAGTLEFAATKSMPSGALVNTGATLAVALGGAGQFTARHVRASVPWCAYQRHGKPGRSGELEYGYGARNRYE